MKQAVRQILRYAIAPVVAMVMIGSMGATDPGGRYQKLGHEMMCTCGCNEILLECNHVSCPDSPHMVAELRADVDAGQSDHQILSAFQAEYGPTVLAAPMLTHFNMIAWIVPPALLLLGILGTLALVRKWRLRAAPIPAPAAVEGFDALRSRIRKETEL
jgi:cytochrome c-type biogenesis protein CcmH/NrfF